MKTLSPTGRRTGRFPGLQPQVPEDLLDHRLFQDGRTGLQLATAVRAVLDVDLGYEASAKSNLHSSYVAAKRRLGILAQLRRTGRWCAQFVSHSARCVACVSGSGSCGTTRARSLALGASTPRFA